ncbi:hypothetical protein GGI25_001782 [Coemansia spiralis]|uniref:Very-long-chain 3-oxoacyl-CoA reductase n=2 Tax=Coemansia TaxID=4863 RepID=A0A9W8G9W7_9FUNG|nr:hypothetical protein GGI26_000990 [Coemansia sp. RSA 1358]KAJ2679213.1 hypothetical protein GGI25_001782 [Coemansia spiralis]
MDYFDYIPNGDNADALYHFKLFNTMQMGLVTAGMMVTIFFLLRIIDILCDLWVRSPVPIKSFGADKGYWAVVTGCTDGIGKELALQLGQHGYNLVLLSRTKSKLDGVRRELEAMDVKVDSYSVDFSNATQDDWNHIEQMIKPKSIGILVNNVGMSHPVTTTFMEESPELCRQMVSVNITTMMNLTRLVVPQMRARANGLVLNIGSWTSMKGMPFLSVYASTKAFVKTFSQSLAYELVPEGITVDHIFSFWVSSKMSGYKTTSISIPSPQVYAKHVLTHIGLRCGSLESYSSVPYPPHSYMGFVATAMWDLRIAPPVIYSIANNLYKLSVKKRQQRSKEKMLKCQ